jgi:hypothetical protein
MEDIEQTTLVNARQRKKRRSVSTAELYAALAAVLPFAQVEIECLADYAATFPDDPDHAADAEQARQGLEAIELARRLIAQKTAYIRRQEQALREGPADGE